MSETKNLRLFKHNEPLETNENKFDIDLALNQNWDKIEEFAGMVNDKVIELEDKDEEQDFNLQELQNEIKKDRENMINLEVEGQSIHIEDSSDLEGKLEVLGNVEQDVREGYNILENILTDSTVNGITVKINKDKSIILNGTATSNTSLDITGNFAITEQSIFSGMCDGYGYNKMLIQIQGSDYNVNIPNSTPQALQPKDNVKVRIYIYAGTSITNAIIKPQINKGTVAKPYEQYGTTPSPEHPSEIRAVGDNINLLENKAKTTTVNGVTFTANEDGAVVANGTATSLAQISLVANVKLPAGTYTIKDGKAYVESTEFNDWFDGLNNPSTLTFNTEVLLKNVYIQVKQGETVNNKIFYPKLEKGAVATSYSEFGQGSVEIKKTSANYYNVKSYVGSQPPPADENDWITLTGNNTGTSAKHLNYFTENLNLNIGKNYWIVAEIKNVSGKGTFHVTSRDVGREDGQFFGNPIQIAEIKKGDKVIFQKTAMASANFGLRTFVSLSQGESCNITFRLSVLETEPNKSNWKYVPYKKETKILPIQKPMLEGDYFNRVDNKEVHTWKKIVLDGVNNKVTQTTTNQSGKYRYQYTDKDLKNCSLSEEKAYCTHLPLIGKSKTYDKILGFTVANNNIYLYTDGDTAVNFNAKLQKENYIFYIPVIESAYQKLELTPKQIEVLDQLENLETYKPVTNISTDSIAKLKLKYIADTKTYIDNKTSNLEQQVNTINQLLSTTKTSSVLLDNLQSDIESEVL